MMYIFLRNNNKQFKKIVYLGITLIMIFVDTNQSFANSITIEEPQNKIVLKGNQTDISETISSIGKYIPETKIQKLPITEKDNVKDNVFVLKPTLTKTESRDDIERKKQEEEIQKQNEIAYNSYSNLSYSYTDYSYQRDVVVRETERLSGTGGNNANTYSYGYCTWYVASMKNVPGLWGNAGEWLGSATQSGYSTGSDPQEGSIIVTGESGYGHVGIVERIEGNKIIISEMNYSGWGIINEREIDTSNPVIRGYIY